MTNFYQASEDILIKLADKIEGMDNGAKLDVEYSDGILSIKVEASNKQYVINRNSANQKIWYSSPLVGADYFAYDETSKKWISDKKEDLEEKLLKELKNFL